MHTCLSQNVRVNAYGIPSNVSGYFLSSCQRHSQEQWILSIETENIPKRWQPLKMQSELDIIKSEGIKLPENYIQKLIDGFFLKSVSFHEYSQEFQLFDLSTLIKKVTVDGMHVLNVQLLRAYSKTLSEFMGENTFDQKGNEFSLERLAESVVIGTENTNLLFIDSGSNGKLGIFRPDGGDVELIDKTIDEIFKK